MNLLRILRFSPLVGGLVLLLASCGAHAPVTGTSFNPPSTGSITGPPTEGTGSPPTEGTGGTGSPPTEGTGLESPQSPTSGVSVSVAGLPTGDGNQAGVGSGNYECIEIQWLGATIPSGVTVTITSVVVVQGDFTTVSAAAAGCTGAGCAEVSSSTLPTPAKYHRNRSCRCPIHRIPPSIPTPPVYGYVRFDGELSCPNTDSATCQQYSSEMTPTPQATFTYHGPTPPGSGRTVAEYKFSLAPEPD